MTLTIREIAILEDVTKRQILRYCSEGYRGHILKAKRVGNKLVVEQSNYRRWRIDCGFDEPEPEPKAAPQVETIAPEPEPAPVPPWNRPSDPTAPLTNCPNEHSSNWCSPAVLREHFEEEHRKMIQELTGGSNAD